jgi:hypothetical protein
MRQSLDIGDFNDKGELKTPVRLVLSLLFISRHLVFLMLAALSHFVIARSGAGFQAGALGLPNPWLLVTDIPVFLFLVLVVRKEKLSKEGWLRRILYLGVPFIVALGVLQIVLIIGLDYRVLLKPELLRVIDLGLLVVCIYYLAANPKVRLFFREYGRPSSQP